MKRKRRALLQMCHLVQWSIVMKHKEIWSVGNLMIGESIAVRLILVFLLVKYQQWVWVRKSWCWAAESQGTSDNLHIYASFLYTITSSKKLCTSQEGGMPIDSVLQAATAVQMKIKESNKKPGSSGVHKGPVGQDSTAKQIPQSMLR